MKTRQISILKLSAVLAFLLGVTAALSVFLMPPSAQGRAIEPDSVSDTRPQPLAKNINLPASPDCAGNWEIVPSPNIEQEGNNDLYAISVLGPNDIWAVGAYRDTRSHDRTLTMHWDGAEWSVVPSPSPAADNNYLYGVVALSPSDVWAVGYYRFPTPALVDKTLILHWDGGAWTQVTSPNVGTSDNNLYAIAALAPDNIWAVGHYRVTGTDYPTLILHWNGIEWTVVASPNLPGAVSNNLVAVGAIASDDIWAVGHARVGAIDQTLALHYNGTEWSLVATPNNGTDSNNFYGIATVAPNDVWAVGHFRNASRINQTLIERWNGTEWSIVPSPNVGSTNNDLFAAVAVGPNDVWAVGQYRSGVYKTLTQRWDGTGWGVIPSASGGTGDNSLKAVAVLDADNIWATGYFTSTGVPHQTLVEIFNTCGTPIATSTVIQPARSATPTSTRTTTPTYEPGQTQTRTATPTMTAGTGTATPTGQPTGEPTGEPSGTPGTPEPTETDTETPTPGDGTPTVTPTPGDCVIEFTDVLPTDYFYESVLNLYCAGAISGYGDGSFRPYNNTTRGQICKIIVLAKGWPIDTTGGQIFSDVPPYNPFYEFIDTAYNRGIISGYSNGQFRWTNNITRAQLSKVVVLAQEWEIDTTGGPHFSDVPADDPFYGFVETIFQHNAISGYGDGSFRPYNNATRGQICKIIYQAISSP